MWSSGGGSSKDVAALINDAVNLSWKYFHQYDKNGDEPKEHRDNYVAVVQNAMMSKLGSAVNTKIGEMDNYLGTLQNLHKKRFGSITGALYDPEIGWNKGYRMQPWDLMTAMDPDPWKPMHPKMDIPFGVPFDHPEEQSKGYLRFKWYFYLADNSLNPTPIVADPILYEIARVKARKFFYKDFYDHVMLRANIRGFRELNEGFGWDHYKNTGNITN